MTDIHRVFRDNNSKKSRMNEADYVKGKIQSVEAIRDNWIGLYSAVTTPVQEVYCNKVLDCCYHKLLVLRARLDILSGEED